MMMLVGNLVGGGQRGIFDVRVSGGSFSGMETLSGSSLVGTKMLKCRKFLD